MPVEFRPVADYDAKAVMDIFNHYIENGFAAYPERPMPIDAFPMFQQLAAGFPFYVMETANKVVGFGLMHPYNRMDTFKRSAEVSYFISPEHTGKGLGTELLKMLVADAKAKGIDTLLVNISSYNEGSIRFHACHGFAECGRFRRVGRKRGRDFDVVWMQRFL